MVVHCTRKKNATTDPVFFPTGDWGDGLLFELETFIPEELHDRVALGRLLDPHEAPVRR